MDNSTIAAIATPGSRGGIGIIKISGPEAASIAKAIFRPHDPCAIDHSANIESTDSGNEPFDSHKLNYGRIVDPENERVLDEVLISVMKAPQTYTREDVVEINAHGGSMALHAVLGLVLKHGARLAEPGEFTRRAFLNGRIDLTQAEAVIDIVNARTEISLQIATSQIEGQLRTQVESIRQHLVDMLTRAEAAIDFPDDVDDIFDDRKMAEIVIGRVVKPLQKLIQNYLDAHVIRDGLNVAVVGKPNVGKSSLMNRMLCKDRAIVTDVPGTTRDVIEDTVNIEGIPVVLLDTAGLHETDDPVETIGIEKTIAYVNGADLVLFMVEADGRIHAEDRRIFNEINAKPLIIVVNKVDLIENEADMVLPDSWSAYDRVFISALYGDGIDMLKKRIAKFVAGDNPIDREAMIVPNIRHKISLERSLQAARDMVAELRNGTTTDLVAIDIQEALDRLEEILGINVKTDILDEIFSQFCIGK
jgi:tRNA modification GTPase